jgi:hypothetical protein
MDLLIHSDCSHARMEGLVNHGLLRVRTTTREWMVPNGHDFLAPPNDYVVSFTHFHEHGLMAPSHNFLLGLLHYSRSSCNI